MKWSSALSEEPDLSRAGSVASDQIAEAFSGESPDLIIAFVSQHHARSYEALSEQLRERFPRSLLIGCSARSVLGGDSELEERPGLALSAAQLPNVSLHPFHVAADDLEAGIAPERWDEIIGVLPGSDPRFILLGDPFTASERFLQALDARFPSSVKIGGLASGGEAPEANALYLGDEIHRSGFIGLALCGNIALDTIVAQGCRPVGNPMFVTRCRGNVLHEVDGRPPTEVLNELYEAAGQRERALFRSSLFLGIEMRSSQMEYRRGDFLIRNLIGGDPDSGSLSVATPLEVTQVVQFHLRDAMTAAEDLEDHLASYSDELDQRDERPGARDGEPGSHGALLFSCLGRGSNLYGVANHDSRLFHRRLGEIPLSGFFCNGEIGPVQAQTFLHGYTSAFGIFSPASQTG